MSKKSTKHPPEDLLNDYAIVISKIGTLREVATMLYKMSGGKAPDIFDLGPAEYGNLFSWAEAERITEVEKVYRARLGVIKDIIVEYEAKRVSVESAIIASGAKNPIEFLNSKRP